MKTQVGKYFSLFIQGILILTATHAFISSSVGNKDAAFALLLSYFLLGAWQLLDALTGTIFDSIWRSYYLGSALTYLFLIISGFYLFGTYVEFIDWLSLIGLRLIPGIMACTYFYMCAAELGGKKIM